MSTNNNKKEQTKNTQPQSKTTNLKQPYELILSFYLWGEIQVVFERTRQYQIKCRVPPSLKQLVCLEQQSRSDHSGLQTREPDSLETYLVALTFVSSTPIIQRTKWEITFDRHCDVRIDELHRVLQSYLFNANCDHSFPRHGSRRRQQVSPSCNQ